MDYKIIKKNAFKVIGKITKVSTQNEGHHTRISEFWEKCNIDGTIEKICAIDNSQNMMGISLGFEADKEQLTYMIAIETVRNSNVNSLDTLEIPAANWAVFTSVGPMPDAIAKVFAKIYGEWFPASVFEQANAPVLEVYYPGNPSAEDYKSEVWMPVLEKIG